MTCEENRLSLEFRFKNSGTQLRRRGPGDTAGPSGGLITCNKTGLSSVLELVAGREESSQFTSKLLGIGEKTADLPTRTC